MKVGFLIAGTQKGGTSALDAYLRQNPHIGMARTKELHYFDAESLFANGAKGNVPAYHAQFEQRDDIATYGESTPIYLWWHPAPARIWQYNRDMKLVFVLRNPIDRAFSHWNMERSRNADDLDFSQAIRAERQRCREALPLQHRVYSYVDRGFYTEQIRRVWQYFPEEQTLFLMNEELRNEPQIVLDRVCGFLGVPAQKVGESLDVHSRPYETQMSAEDRQFLRDVYKYEVAELERLLEWDCSHWLEADTSVTCG